MPASCYTAAVTDTPADEEPDRATSDATPAPPRADAAPPEPPTVSWFSIVRKRMGPLILFLGIALLIHETCKSKERREVTIRLDLGRDAARVRHLWADVFVDGESVATYERAAGAGTPQLKASLFGETAELRIDLELAPLTSDAPAERRVITRRLHAEGGSTVTIPLADELAR